MQYSDSIAQNNGIHINNSSQNAKVALHSYIRIQYRL